MPWWAVRVFYAAAAIGEWRFLHTTSSREREARVQSTRSREFLLSTFRITAVSSPLTALLLVLLENTTLIAIPEKRATLEKIGTVP
jgi:hypothetical protein